MGRSAWSWSSKGRATASVTGLALDGSTVTNDLELQALCLEPLESQSSIGIFRGKRADICVRSSSSNALRGAVASVAGLALAWSALTSDLELQALC